MITYNINHTDSKNSSIFKYEWIKNKKPEKEKENKRKPCSLSEIQLYQYTAHKMTISIKGFFSKCDQNAQETADSLLKKSLMVNFVFVLS